MELYESGAVILLYYWKQQGELVSSFLPYFYRDTFLDYVSLTSSTTKWLRIKDVEFLHLNCTKQEEKFVSFTVSDALKAQVATSRFLSFLENPFELYNDCSKTCCYL